MLAARSLDPQYGLRTGLAQIAAERGDWAGIPLPMDGHRLIIEPTYPKAAELMAIGAAAREDAEAAEQEGEYRLRNKWWSFRRRADILIMERVADGKIAWGLRSGVHHISFDLQTLGASDAWGIEQEANAIHLLAGMTRHRQFKQYMLTGMFLEKSKRSGVTYMFRRLKPTVALAAQAGIPDTEHKPMKILACLCQHPIAYYADSWAGAMCPTDDVIAALAMMRGDEAMFWKRSTQHPPYRPEAGL